MRLLSSLAALLLMALFAGRDNLTTGEARIEQSSNNAVKNAPRRGRLTIRDTGEWTCGRLRHYLEPMSRGTIEIDDDYYDDDISYDTVDGTSDLEKILGGTYVRYSEVPWQVNIREHDDMICSGVIINAFWIITAAHCVSPENKDYLKFVVGDHRLSFQEPYEQVHIASEIIRHEQFTTDKYGTVTSNDIALVKVKGNLRADVGIRLNDHVQAVCLPKASEIPKLGRFLIVTGWGETAEGSDASDILKTTELPVISMEYCKKYYTKYVTARAICAGYDYISNTEICRGDSGGPAVIDTREGKILIGIVSGGQGCKPPIRPALFTLVPKYRDWIDKTVKKYSSGNQGVMPNRSYSVFGPLPEGELY